jgi:hypothetical protein
MVTKTTAVPRGNGVNPISFLLEHRSSTIAALAGDWGVTPDAVYRYRRYEIAPRSTVAKRMAATFGWTLGEVIEHWAEKVAA